MPERTGGRCDCEPSCGRRCGTRQRQQRIRRTFGDRAEARTWRRDALVALRRGRTVTRTVATLEQAGDAWLEQAPPGWCVPAAATATSPPRSAPTRRRYGSGRTRCWAPSRSTRSAAPTSRTSSIGLVGDGLAATTIETTVNAVRAIYRRELGGRPGQAQPDARRDAPVRRRLAHRFATPAEAKALLARCRPRTGRCGPPRSTPACAVVSCWALRDQAIDLEASEIRVVAGWDAVEGEQPTKGRERRTVPIIGELRTILAAHRLRTGRRGTDLMFGEPRRPRSPRSRCRRAPMPRGRRPGSSGSPCTSAATRSPPSRSRPASTSAPSRRRWATRR